MTIRCEVEFITNLLIANSIKNKLYNIKPKTRKNRKNVQRPKSTINVDMKGFEDIA